MKKLTFIIILALLAVSCGKSENKNETKEIKKIKKIDTLQNNQKPPGYKSTHESDLENHEKDSTKTENEKKPAVINFKKK